jgi:hypothetical protein
MAGELKIKHTGGVKMRINLCANGVICKTLSEPVKPVVEEKQTEAIAGLRQVGRVVTMAGGTLALVLPQVAFASTDTFNNVFDAVMGAFDAGVVLVIVFAGASWALGHRSKAIEILIGVCCGYILARHAIDIRDFLKGI